MGLPSSPSSSRKSARVPPQTNDKSSSSADDDNTNNNQPDANADTTEKCSTPGCTFNKHSTNVQHSFHKGCKHPMCSKPPHSDMELHSFNENLPSRRGGRSAPQIAHVDEANLNFVTVIHDDVAQSALQIDVDSLLMSDISEPNTYEQAIASGHHKEWHASMTKEWTELMSNNTFHEPINRSSLPPGAAMTSRGSEVG
eukprot:6199881-Prymnesium_polylepis.1